MKVFASMLGLLVVLAWAFHEIVFLHDPAFPPLEEE